MAAAGLKRDLNEWDESAMLQTESGTCKTRLNAAASEVRHPTNLPARPHPLLPDLSTAFDTMSHQIFLSTLSGLGISGYALLEAAPIRSRQASLRAWQISQLGCRPTTPSQERAALPPGEGLPSPSWLTTTVSPSQSAKNFGVALDNTLSFSANIKAVAHSCRFMLYNIPSVRPHTLVRIQAHCWLGSQFVPSNPCNLPRTLQPA
ncbi:uncharacterized protein LOC120051246 [Salvelinus namaycush]|uniref:Uncharacterized protein LOC120051246 n=1 Tax=Salvelinus namaycush TaxID=8040 RepID=A0A8U0R2P1_SALNM|nr:uncharacterized protein LOC120051246 [Salvelinus namaycush]